jgi:hypothetical protein
MPERSAAIFSFDTVLLTAEAYDLDEAIAVTAGRLWVHENRLVARR